MSAKKNHNKIIITKTSWWDQGGEEERGWKKN